MNMGKQKILRLKYLGSQIHNTEGLIRTYNRGIMLGGENAKRSCEISSGAFTAGIVSPTDS